jgi:hypothetical protein
MNHKKCGGQIVLDLSGSFVINSPSLNITTKGISPGMIQIDASSQKKRPVLICKICEEKFSTQDEFEEGILEICGVCGHEYPPSEIRVTDFISRICNNCMKDDGKKSDSSQKRILFLYGEVIRKVENPTLLTILMKK